MRHYTARPRYLVGLFLRVFAGLTLVACSPATGDDESANARSVQVSTTRENAPSGNAAIVDRASENLQRITPVAARQAAPPPARDADQDFLRHMLDQNETVLATMHAQMMEPAGHAEHGMRADPAGLDAKIDVDKREMLALLKKYYSEEYSPRVTPQSSVVSSASSGGMAGMSMPSVEKGEADPMAARMRVAAQLRDGAAIADRFAPNLKRPAVASLARRMRTSRLRLARELGAGMQSQ
jgi:hypothetical protein